MFGILSDYADLADKYNSGKISFSEFKVLCEKRSKSLNPNKTEIMSYVNKEIISNK